MRKEIRYYQLEDGSLDCVVIEHEKEFVFERQSEYLTNFDVTHPNIEIDIIDEEELDFPNNTNGKEPLIDYRPFSLQDWIDIKKAYSESKF